MCWQGSSAPSLARILHIHQVHHVALRCIAFDCLRLFVVFFIFVLLIFMLQWLLVHFHKVHYSIFTDLKDKQSPSTVKASARQLIAMELLQTEKNYVGILNTILKVNWFLENYLFIIIYYHSSCIYLLMIN